MSNSEVFEYSGILMNKDYYNYYLHFLWLKILLSC